MGVSNLTAYIIASNPDVQASAGGPAKNGKYVGWITLGEEARYRPLLNSEPIYDTPEQAKEAMQKTIMQIKEQVENELDGKDPITHVMSEAGASQEEIDTTKQVIAASKGKL